MDEQRPTPEPMSDYERYCAKHGYDPDAYDNPYARIMGDVVAVIRDPRYQQKPADTGNDQADPPDAV